MASKFNALLNQIGNGILRPKGQMADWQHAARVFGDDNFRLAPKSKFLYHVYFNINRSAVFINQFTQRHGTELGLLVKQVDLPRFNIRTQTLNQYNRKKVIQLTQEYGPMTFRFHDDRAHIVNMMWQSYYKYYYADSTTAEQSQSYNRSAYKSYDYIRGPHGYDNNSSISFFNSIILYQLNKREYISYELINPLISNFVHDVVQASDQGGQGSECLMTVNFEAVKYDSGSVSSGNVLGFATTHYDKSPSPISAAGGGTASLFGGGGILEGASSVFSSLSKGTGPGGAFNNLGNLINTAATAINTYENTKRMGKDGLKQEGTNLLAGAAVVGAGLAINGLKNTVFPSATTDSDKTRSTQRNDLIGGGP